MSTAQPPEFGQASGTSRLSTARDAQARVPFGLRLSGGHTARLGSVARAHLTALQLWPQWLEVTPAGVWLTAEDAGMVLHTITAVLRDQGLVHGWRDEPFALWCLDTGQRLGSLERAAARFWGTLTQGAHATGYVADAQGRPAQLWLARRADTKATDPGLWDNLIGGGVPDGQTPLQTLVREGWEEAGLQPTQMAAAQAGPVLRVHRDVPQGLQLEDLFSFDLPVPAGWQPVNQDGEVAGFECLPVAEALALASSGLMTVDAAVVTLDFAQRHHL